MKRCVLLIVGLAACGPVVSFEDTDDGSSSAIGSTATTRQPEPEPPMPTTAPPNPVTTGVDPSSTGDVPDPPPPVESTGEASSTGFSSTSRGGESSSSGGIPFIDPTGGPLEDCDPYLQNCPDGEKCNAYAEFGGSAWDALGCFPLDPDPGQAGDACTVEDSAASGIDSCAAGTMCWDVDQETLEGTCTSMCEGSADMPSCADPDTTCIITNGGVLNLCLPTCDPLLQDCGAGQGCYPVDAVFACVSPAPTAGGPGQDCAFINDCTPGLTCVPTDIYGLACGGGSGCCSPFCDVTLPAMCPDPQQECLPLFDDGTLPPNLDDLGVCSVPS